MQKIFSRSLYITGTFTACLMMMFTTGCASGGFKLTRQYARFVNSQHIIIRIVLYILTIVVFAVTMLIDMVINNTIEFWEGRVSANTYEFQQDGKTYVAKHEVLSETNLKRSTITILDENKKLVQTVVLAETPKHEIELFVDGVLRTKVDGIRSLPQITSYDKNGKLLEQKTLDLSTVASR